MKTSQFCQLLNSELLNAQEQNLFTFHTIDYGLGQKMPNM